MHYRSIADMNNRIIRNLWQVPPDAEVIVGIPRSGLLAANILALHLNLPLTDVDGLCDGRLFRTGKRVTRGMADDLLASPRHVVVVDDCVSLGNELGKVRARLEEADLPHRLTYLCVYAFPEGVHHADVVLETVPRPMCFEWSFLHSDVLGQVCLDIDGVLCVDPTKDEDDDGPRYAEFLRCARPLFVPTAEVGALVTSRLERYREPTEAWLREHGIRYRQLIMMDVPEGQSRTEGNRHVAFKARAYEETGAQLFVESSPGLALHLAEATGRPVLSLATNEMIAPSLSTRVRVRVQRARWWGRRARRLAGRVTRTVARGRR